MPFAILQLDRDEVDCKIAQDSLPKWFRSPWRRSKRTGELAAMIRRASASGVTYAVISRSLLADSSCDVDAGSPSLALDLAAQKITL